MLHVNVLPQETRDGIQLVQLRVTATNSVSSESQEETPVFPDDKTKLKLPGFISSRLAAIKNKIPAKVIRRKAQIVVALRFITALLLIPALMTIIGVIMEAAVYGSKNAPGYHYRRLFYAGLIAAPFILIRWFWRWPKHLSKLELFFYLISTGGFLTALILSTINGTTLFFLADHIRDVFSGSTYNAITSQQDVYKWLRFALGNAYNDSEPFDFVTRTLPGQVRMFSRTRLKQSRSVIADCSHEVASLPGTVEKVCYQQFSLSNQDTSNFSSLEFGYMNPSFKNYADINIKAHDILTSGQLGTYPIAGHWIIWPTITPSKEVFDMLEAMENASWIDFQTRQISLDFVVLAKDLPRPVAANVIYMIEVTPSGKFLPNPPIMSFSYFDFIRDIGLDNDGNNKCAKVAVQEKFLLPIYLGIVPSIIYMVFLHLRQVAKSWRDYISSIYTYSEVMWVVMVSMAIGFRWHSIYFAHCNTYFYDQTSWPSGDQRRVGNFEFLPMAANWESARRSLAVALFLQIFNLLKVISNVGARLGSAKFDTMASTVQHAIKELASFAFSFSIIFIGFVAMFYLVFSAEDSNYQSLPRTVATIWLGLMGEIEFSDGIWRLKEWALPFVIFFTFFAVFILLTVIIAIISDAYEKTKEKKHRLLSRISQMNLQSQR